MNDNGFKNKEGIKVLEKELNPLFDRLKIKCSATVSIYSYENKAPVLFYPVLLGPINEAESKHLEALFHDKFEEVITRFSFTKLLHDNNVDVWLCFNRGGNDVKPVKQDEQQLLIITCDTSNEDNEELVDRLVEIKKDDNKKYFNRYGKMTFKEFKKQNIEKIKDTLEIAVNNVLKSGVTNIYFITIDVPLEHKKVGGILAINSLAEIEFRDLFRLIEPYTRGILSKFIVKEIEKARIESTIKSAVAAIIGRNASHNIGSHVLARISTGSRDGEGEARNISSILGKMGKGTVVDSVLEERIRESVAWIKDVQILSKYIQQRMDFIAQIATMWPMWSEPAYLMKDLMSWWLKQKHLLDFIAKSEELRAHFYLHKREAGNGDVEEKGEETDQNNKETGTFQESKEKEKKGEKEDTKDAKKEGDIRIHIFLVPEECWNEKSESIKKRHDNLIKYCEEHGGQRSILGCRNRKNGEGGTDKGKGCQCHRILLYTTPISEEYSTEEDIALAMRGGIIGYHALYVILENVVRNAAKHAYPEARKKGEDHLDIILEVLYDPDETIGIEVDGKKKPAALLRIYDNTTTIGKNENDNRLILWRGDESQEDGMNDRLRTSFIDHTGALRKENWGLGEMKISCGYLQGRSLMHIGAEGDLITGKKDEDNLMLKEGKSKKGGSAIIRAVISPIGTMAYEFYVLKPRLVGIVCPSMSKERHG